MAFFQLNAVQFFAIVDECAWILTSLLILYVITVLYGDFDFYPHFHTIIFYSHRYGPVTLEYSVVPFSLMPFLLYICCDKKKPSLTHFFKMSFKLPFSSMFEWSEPLVTTWKREMTPHLYSSRETHPQPNGFIYRWDVPLLIFRLSNCIICNFSMKYWRFSTCVPSHGSHLQCYYGVDLQHIVHCKFLCI